MDYYDKRLRAFGVSWISNYGSENEWIFCGGRYGIKVEDVRMQKSGEKYYTWIKALYCFDAMLNGTDIDVTNVTKQDFKILKSLIDHKLHISRNKYDKYINDTFTAMTDYKTQLIIICMI